MATKTNGGAGKDAAAITESPFALKEFEVWRAEPIFKFRLNEDTGLQERYQANVELKGEKPISVTLIEQRQADELNSHLENSKLFYKPKTAKDAKEGTNN